MNPEVRKLAWFIWRHYPPAKDWGRKLLWGWLGFHCANGFVGAIKDNPISDRIVGVGIARPVMKPEDGHDCYEYDPEGSCIFVDLALAADARAFKSLAVIMRKRFGTRDRIAFMRLPDLTIRSYNYRRMMHLALRKETANGLI